MEADLRSRLRGYFLGRRDSKTERALQCELRGVAEEERHAILVQLMPLHSAAALQFAFSCLSNTRYFEGFLVEGLEKGDASSIRTWLQFTVPKLGVRRTLRILSEQGAQNPRGVAFALYWLPNILNSNHTLTDTHRGQIRQLLAQVSPPRRG